MLTKPAGVRRRKAGTCVLDTRTIEEYTGGPVLDDPVRLDPRAALR